MKILVVEDDALLRENLQKALEKENFAIDCVIDGEQALFQAQNYDYDLIVLDIGLPKITGIDVIKRLRLGGSIVPILLLTARGHWQDKVEGLEAGADDYLVKPFHIKELTARINVLIRRAHGSATPIIEAGQIVINTATQAVFINKVEVDLTAYEYKVLVYLMQHPGKVISKTELTEHLYEQDFDRDSNVIEVFVGRLRKKIDPDQSVQPIETLKNRGYRFTLTRK